MESLAKRQRELTKINAKILDWRNQFSWVDLLKGYELFSRI